MPIRSSGQLTLLIQRQWEVVSSARICLLGCSWFNIQAGTEIFEAAFSSGMV